ncbi:hypothetical protein K9M48_01065 [Candidatus Gracilibacteria bacterium]|nr:hypothetical protein [Candidatus Gracilibacteria bacterium]
MGFYNLSSYIKNGLFLQDIRNDNFYKLIIFEKKIDLIPDALSFDVKFLTDSSENFVKQISSYMDQYENVLLILDESYSGEIHELMQIKKGNISIVNLNTGVAGLGNKSKMDIDDIHNFLSLGFEVYDPRDLQNLLGILSKENNKYIRLNHNNLAQDIMYLEDFAIIDKDLVGSKDILSFVNNGFSGLQGTVISSGGLVLNVLQALQILQANGCTLDYFAVSNLDFKIEGELWESVRRNELVVMIFDQIFPSSYSEFLKDKFKKIGMGGVRIKFIYPEYDKLNTVLEDYKFEQAGLDSSALVKKINNIIKS